MQSPQMPLPGMSPKLQRIAERAQSEPSLRFRSLAHLIDIGLVIRNPGYGHPLRPEYLLTDNGRGVAESSERLHRTDQAGTTGGP